jgi:hypothetical protein
MTVRVQAVATVRAALMQSIALAASADRASWRAYRAALEAIGYVGEAPVSIDLDRHAWALLTALERRAGIAREELDGTGPQTRERTAWVRMVIAEVTMSALGLAGGVIVTAPYDNADMRVEVSDAPLQSHLAAQRRRARWQRARR